MKLRFGFVFLLLIAACRPNTASVETLPTLAQMPTAVAEAIVTATEAPRRGPPTLPASFTPAPTQTSAATFTRMPTSAVSSTPYPDLMIPIEEYASNQLAFPTSVYGSYDLEVGGDFSNGGDEYVYGSYTPQALNGVSEIMWSITIEDAEGVSYLSYIRVCYPDDLTPGRYTLESELGANPSQTTTVLFWYNHDNYGQIIFPQNVSGSINFTSTGSEVSATFDYTGSRGEETITFEGSVEGARPDY